MNNIFNERNGLQEIIDNVLDEMTREAGGNLNYSDINLSEFQRRTGLSRSKARTLKAKDFKVQNHGRCGKKSSVTVISNYADMIDDLLKRGVTNSSVCFDRIKEAGYSGGLTTVKSYIASHRSLVPAKRKLIAPQGSRGQRYQTKPGEAYQMDWGFLQVNDYQGNSYRIACFAMVCHHCGTCYIEFFSNAKQENLFIGMLHAFIVMGVPEYVFTDNMKSVVLRRDFEGKPVWQSDYAEFMNCIGFKTKLCRPRHPFTKGAVERLVRFVKENFAAGRCFQNITQLNFEALEWCAQQSSHYRKAQDLIPAEAHKEKCIPASRSFYACTEAEKYLFPLRKISFDGFVSYEGRRFGVPYWYSSKVCRVNRDGNYLHIFSEDLTKELCVHSVTWSYKDSFCENQYVDEQPYELPSTPVKTVIKQLEEPHTKRGFERFDFESRF